MLRVLILLLRRDTKLRILFITCCILAFMAVGLTIKTITGLIKNESDRYSSAQTDVVDTEELFNKIHILENKVRENPDNPSIHIDLGNLYYEIGEKNKAKIELYRAVALSKEDDFRAKYELIRLYINLDEYYIAKTILSEIPSNKNFDKNKKAELLILLAEMAEEQNEYFDSSKMYEAALGFYNPSSAQYIQIQQELSFVYERIADLYYLEGNIVKAIEYLNNSLEKKKSSSAFFKLGMIYEIEGNLDDAVKNYNFAYQLNKEGINVDVFNNALRKRIAKDRGSLSEKDFVQLGVFIKNTDKNVNEIVLLKNIHISNVNTEYLRLSEPKDSVEAVLQFQIANVSNKIVDNLKVRIIFANDGKIFDFRDLYVASKKHPLEKLSYTNSISVEAKPIVAKDDKNIVVFIYISTSDEDDKWILNKTAVIYVQ